MIKMEKLPKLVDVYQPSCKLESRQLPLVVDENLTLVMDIKNSNIICDSQNLTTKELNEFSGKLSILTAGEIQTSIQITIGELTEVLNQTVPCVGCRRSVERLYLQLLNFGHPTLDPIIVQEDGTISIRKEKQAYNILANIFHDHAQRLETVIETQPKRNKKSVRCLLHSLDSQRSRPLTPVWREVWDCMKMDCRKDVCIIEAASLYSTLENYLRKHRFCGECRTKVLKAYTLLLEEKEPTKEKGYVSALYAGIKRCLQDKHIHLNPKTEYITKLINRAEPELLGSRRERHAKTLEIAQEEVLTCLGICMYERLHRIYMRVREEERTCQLFAAVAIHTLHRRFETVIDSVRGVSQLELLYEEFAREEQAKQKHKEAKKIRRKRRKGIKMACYGDDDGKEPSCCDEAEDALTDKECSCSSALLLNNKEDYGCSSEETDEFDECSNNNNNKLNNNCGRKLEKSRSIGRSIDDDIWLEEDCRCDNNDDIKELTRNRNKETTLMLCKCESVIIDSNNKKESGSNSDHSQDYGYSSSEHHHHHHHHIGDGDCCGGGGGGETGSVVSSSSSSAEGSELACTDIFCCQPQQQQQQQQQSTNSTDFGTQCRLTCGGGLSLQEMLDVHSEEDEECFITAEEVREFKMKSRQVYEKRRELRETLQKRFAQFCHNGPNFINNNNNLMVPHLLLQQTKYASN